MRNNQVLLQETKQFLYLLNARQVERLTALWEEDLQIIDVDFAGDAIFFSDSRQWAAYLAGKFALLDALNIHVETRVMAYEGSQSGDIAYSTVRYQQCFCVGIEVTIQHLSGTLIWRRVGDRWKVIRWHCSLECQEDQMLEEHVA